MTEKIIWVDFKTLERFIIDVFKKSGVKKDDAKICANILITADKKGIDSHGINRLKSMYYDKIKQGILNPVTNLEIVKESPATAVIDGHNGIGHVIAKKSMQIAIDKAKKFGMGMAVVRNSNHYGIAGYYPLMAVDAGMIGISGTNARPSIAPSFGVENMLGTNPLSFAMPSDEKFPFSLDCATSVAQRGKIEVYAKKNKDIPKGWVIDRKGEIRTDSEQILIDLVKGNAALVPLGGVGDETAGYKGYGYATVVEILSAALQQGRFMNMLTGLNEKGGKVPHHIGHFFIAINILAFTELDKFKKTTGDILRTLRASKKMPGYDKIYTSGEKEYLTYMERKNKGAPLNRQLQNEIKEMIKELNLKQYESMF